MGMFRCAQCAAPMTDEETNAGACPMCGAEVAKPQTAAAKIPKHMQESTSPGLVRSLLFAVVGTLLFCFLPIGIIFYNNLPEKKEKPAEEKKEELHAEVKKPVTPPPARKDSPPEKLKEEKKKEEKKKSDASLDETMPEEKKVEPKPEEKKIEVKPKEKKPDEPKAIVKEVKPVPPPPIDKARFAVLPFLKDDAITIDGNLTDWKDVPPIVLTALARGRVTKKPVDVPQTIIASAAWCSKGILIAADVPDTSGELENAGKPDKGMWPFWENDTLEIYIDTLNARPAKRGAPSEHQFFVLPFGAPGEMGHGGYESRLLKNKAGRVDWTIAGIPMPAMRTAGKKTLRGWTIETLIPFSAMRETDLVKAGSVIGLELQIDSGTNVFYHWTNHDAHIRSSEAPRTWGEALLAGSDARVELLDKDLKPAVAVITGQPLFVRVTDADVNLDPAKKGQLSITFFTKAGPTPLVLEETSSGVFVGRIETQRNAPRRDMLSVVVGETIRLEYVERIRANGERDKKIVAELPCRAAP